MSDTCPTCGGTLCDYGEVVSPSFVRDDDAPDAYREHCTLHDGHGGPHAMRREAT